MAFLKTKLATWEFARGGPRGRLSYATLRSVGVCSRSLPHRKPNCSLGPVTPASGRLLGCCGQRSRPLHHSCPRLLLLPSPRMTSGTIACGLRTRGECLLSLAQQTLSLLLDLQLSFVCGPCVLVCCSHPSTWGAFPFFSAAARSPVVGLP